MPTIILEANSSGGATAERTFSERVVTQNLQSGHYNFQLLERLKWAVADAEAAEVGAASPVEPPRALESLYFG